MQASTPDSNDKPRPSVPTVTPKRATGAVDTTVLPSFISFPSPFIRCMAAGTGDVLYVNTREILAVEIRSENGGVVLVLKDGKAVPVADDYRVVIDRLHHRPSTGLIADHRLDVNVGEGTHRHHG